MVTASSMEWKALKYWTSLLPKFAATFRSKRLSTRLTFTLHQLGTKHQKFTSPFSYLFILRPINILTPLSQSTYSGIASNKNREPWHFCSSLSLFLLQHIICVQKMCRLLSDFCLFYLHNQNRCTLTFFFLLLWLRTTQETKCWRI